MQTELPTIAIPAPTFVDRRQSEPAPGKGSYERRQFADGHQDLTDEARELGEAIDQYKFRHRRRFISYEEILSVVKSLGYERV